MTTTDNPFAGLAAMRDTLASSAEPAAVAAPVAPGGNPFAHLVQPPPLAPTPAPALLEQEPVIEPAAVAEPVAEEEPVAIPEPTVAPEPPVTEEPKPKRRPGRPRKRPAEDSSGGDAPKDRATYLRDIAATEAPATAFVKLTAEVSDLEQAREDLSSKVSNARTRLEESTATRTRVTAQIEELTRFLETLSEQDDALRAEVDARNEELSSVQDELTVASESLTRVRDFITALSGGNPGIIGGVRVTVLDGVTHIDPL